MNFLYEHKAALAAAYSKDAAVQLIFPSKIVIELFAVMGNVEKLLQIFALAVMALALLCRSLYIEELCIPFSQKIYNSCLR